ncbi:cupin [Maribacter sp. 4U21]|uniref:AraC family transcriptional regulator n=1 Tax=Maribacter sp. 4U21 TaxID=1889779 RepID=UPI000C16177A|nr:AraC family transcriptional regulator [Maribacter sp. 4U21]PIB27728.1 cupin [Maribacter sp. 4U21]
MKVLPFEISKPVDVHLLVQIDKGLVFFDKLHQHKEIQISLIVNGSGKLIVGDSVHSFGAGEVFVIGSQVPHLFQSTPSKEHAHMISLFFTPHSFGADFFNIPDLEQITPFFKVANKSFKVSPIKPDIIEIMLQIPLKDKLNRFMLFLKLLELISSSKVETLIEFINPKALNSNEGKRLQDVFDYVTKNFQADIKLATAANLSFMTPNAFCRFFKQRTDKSFFQFLIELRIAHACQLLVTKKDMTIIEVAEESGFKSISNFNKKFKSLKKCTPSDYRISVGA